MALDLYERKKLKKPIDLKYNTKKTKIAPRPYDSGYDTLRINILRDEKDFDLTEASAPESKKRMAKNEIEETLLISQNEVPKVTQSEGPKAKQDIDNNRHYNLKIRKLNGYNYLISFDDTSTSIPARYIKFCESINRLSYIQLPIPNDVINRILENPNTSSVCLPIIMSIFRYSYGISNNKTTQAALSTAQLSIITGINRKRMYEYTDIIASQGLVTKNNEQKNERGGDAKSIYTPILELKKTDFTLINGKDALYLMSQNSSDISLYLYFAKKISFPKLITTIGEIRRVTGLSRNAIQKSLDKLVADGIIENKALVKNNIEIAFNINRKQRVKNILKEIVRRAVKFSLEGLEDNVANVPEYIIDQLVLFISSKENFIELDKKTEWSPALMSQSEAPNLTQSEGPLIYSSKNTSFKILSLTVNVLFI